MDFDEAYRVAATIRAVEWGIVKRYYSDPGDSSVSPMRCPVHLSIGQETLAAAVRSVVGGPESQFPPMVYSTHRAHAHYLAFTDDIDGMIAELYGRATGCAGGWGGSMHLINEELGFMGTSAIVGSSISLAVGAAMGAKLAGRQNLTIAFIGDSAVESGQYYEALNFASLHSLRLLIVEEDNGLSTATGPEHRQPEVRIVQPHITTDDSKYDLLHTAISRAAANATATPGPIHIRIKTNRFFEHVGVNRDSWRSLQMTPQNDPLFQLGKELSDPVRRSIDYDIEQRVDRAFELAAVAPWPKGVAI